jgi:hypothetical protein
MTPDKGPACRRSAMQTRAVGKIIVLIVPTTQALSLVRKPKVIYRPTRRHRREAGEAG